MKIKNKRSFVLAIVFIMAGMICFGAVILNNFQVRILVSGVFFILLGLCNLVFAFSKNGLEEEIMKSIDERDIYLAMKSGHMTVKITNYFLYAGCLSALVLYGIYKLSIFITIALTLAVVIIFVFIIMLLVNIYYEKHE